MQRGFFLSPILAAGQPNDGEKNGYNCWWHHGVNPNKFRIRSSEPATIAFLWGHPENCWADVVFASIRALPQVCTKHQLTCFKGKQSQQYSRIQLRNSDLLLCWYSPTKGRKEVLKEPDVVLGSHHLAGRNRSKEKTPWNWYFMAHVWFFSGLLFVDIRSPEVQKAESMHLGNRKKVKSCKIVLQTNRSVDRSTHHWPSCFSSSSVSSLGLSIAVQCTRGWGSHCKAPDPTILILLKTWTPKSPKSTSIEHKKSPPEVPLAQVLACLWAWRFKAPAQSKNFLYMEVNGWEGLTLYKTHRLNYSLNALNPWNSDGAGTNVAPDV